MFRVLLKIIVGILLLVGFYYFYIGFIADEALMEPDYDVNLGREVVAQIAADTVEYPLLSREEHPEVYAFIDGMVEEVVSSPKINYKGIFKYDSVQIINRDDVLNAFCTPGGFIYVYTGLIKYLDAKDHLAGVLGHEIAHAELRHSSIRLQKDYGRKKLMTLIILTTPANLGDAVRLKILHDLMTLDYSRDQEADADRWSVRYLSGTQYACDGTAGFFEKLLAEGKDVQVPEFLSDHPDSEARVKSINREAKKRNCSIDLADQSDWKHIQELLPKPDTVLANTDTTTNSP